MLGIYGSALRALPHSVLLLGCDSIDPLSSFSVPLLEAQNESSEVWTQSRGMEKQGCAPLLICKEQVKRKTHSFVHKITNSFNKNVLSIC